MGRKVKVTRWQYLYHSIDIQLSFKWMTKQTLNFVPFIYNWCFLTNKPAIAIINKGKSSHFFKMSSETLVSCDRHPFSEPNTLFGNNHLKFLELTGQNSYMWLQCEKQQKIHLLHLCVWLWWFYYHNYFYKSTLNGFPYFWIP